VAVDPAAMRPTTGSEETVEGAARRSPRAAEILRGLGIDTCCGGSLTLAQAAASAGVPVETVLEALGAGRGT
jgi:regulator of cell morphogenesis and NO signaling